MKFIDREPEHKKRQNSVKNISEDSEMQDTVQRAVQASINTEKGLFVSNYDAGINNAPSIFEAKAVFKTEKNHST